MSDSIHHESLNDASEFSEQSPSNTCEYRGQLNEFSHSAYISPDFISLGVSLFISSDTLDLPELISFLEASLIEQKFNGADVYRFTYCTQHPYETDQLTLTGGILLIPKNDNPSKQEIDRSDMALNINAHGTTTLRSYALTEAKTVGEIVESAFIELLMVQSQHDKGIVVASADGIGLGFPNGYPDNYTAQYYSQVDINEYIDNPIALNSEDVFHPYMLKQALADTQIDMINVIPTILNEIDIEYGLSGKLILTGYSEGGSSTMATAIDMQKTDFIASTPFINEILALPSGGAYDISRTMLDALLSEGYPVNYFLPYVAISLANKDASDNLVDSPAGSYFPSFNDFVTDQIPASIPANRQEVIQKWMDNNSSAGYDDFVSDVLFSGFFSSTIISQYLPHHVAEILETSLLDAHVNHDTNTPWYNNILTALEEQDSYRWQPSFTVHTCADKGDAVIPIENTYKFLQINQEAQNIHVTHKEVMYEGEGISHEMGGILCTLDSYDRIQDFIYGCNNELGDANKDEKLDVLDVFIIVDFIMQHNLPDSPCRAMTADYNQDNTINILDVVDVIREILISRDENDLIELLS